MTTATNHDPADCHLCSNQAHGIGVGFTSQRDKDPKWVCVDCSLLLEDFRRVKRMDAYQVKALEMVDEIAGDYCGNLGKTDMADMDELERRMLWKAVVNGYGASLRKLVREGVPW